MSRPARFRATSIAVTAVAAAALAWASQHAGTGERDLAAVHENECSVIAGNGKVVTQPAAKCPVDITLGKVLATSGGAAHSLAPGDTAWRPVDVQNVGRTGFDRLSLTTQPAVGALGTTLRLAVRRCSVGWSATSSGYTCRGAAVTLLNDASAAQTRFDLGASPATQRQGIDRLLIGLTLLTSSGNQRQGAETTMTYTFSATRN